MNQESEQTSCARKRFIKPLTPLKPYSLPRYRITLVCAETVPGLCSSLETLNRFKGKPSVLRRLPKTLRMVEVGALPSFSKHTRLTCSAHGGPIL
jgi:hypothetical protein